MAIVLEARSADGTVTRTPIEAGRNSFRAQPGMRYRVLDDTGAKIDDTISIRRIGNDLVISGLPESRLVEFDGFFSRCTPQNSCELMLENLGETTPAASITPASEPLAAQRDGSFLMYAGKSAEAPLPVAPEAEPPQTFRTVGLVVAGLALAGAGGGGGGGGGGSAPADTTPPPQPVVNTGTVTKSSRPVISGTAEPGSTVSVFIDIDGNGQFPVRFVATADPGGNWAVDTATSSPVAGAMRDIPSGAQVGIRVLAVDAGNNVSTAYSYTLAVDTVAPVAPVIGMVAGNDIVNGAEKAAGVTISGTAEAGATVAVTWGTVTHSVVAGANGAWSVRFEPGEVPPDNPSSTITAAATDAAGNVGPAASRVIVVDSTSVVVIASVTADDIVNGAERAAGVVISGSAKPGASVVLTWGTLSRVINVDPTGTGDWTTTVATTDVPADGSTTITATSTDSAGNVGVYSRTVLIDTAAPTPPTIASIPEAAGGLNQAEVADGTVVNVNLAGSTAVAGDTLIVHWGTQNVTRVIAPGEAGTVVAVTIPASVIANQGNGNVSVTASVNDAQGNIGGNSAATVVSVDTVVPSLTIGDNVSGTATGPVTFTFSFSEAVTGFTASDIVVTGGTPGALTGSGASYSMVVTPAASSAGTITVSVAAGAATDAAGNGNTAATPATQAFNTFSPPTLTITDSTAAATTNAPVTFNFTFSEPVTGFAASDIVVAGGTAGTLSGSGASYSMVVTPTAGAAGTITVDVAANAAIGASSGLGNTAAPQATQAFDTQAPTLAITDNVAGTASGPITFTFTFSEPVTGFTASDIVVAGGTAGALTGSGASYSMVVTPPANSSGTITVDVAAGVAADATGNGNTAAAQATQPYLTLPAPSLTITDSTAAATTNAPVTFNFTFSEPVTGFTASDVVVTGGTAGALTGSGASYSMIVTPPAGNTGTISVDVAAGAATGTTSGLGNTDATAATQAFDTQMPTVAITDNISGTASGPVTFMFAFSEPVTGFTASDIVVAGGTAGALTGSGASYSMVVTPPANSSGTITVDVAAGVAADATGNGNTAAAQATQPYLTLPAPSLTITDSTAAATTNAPVTFNFTFSEPVTGFTASDVVVTGGTAGALTGSGASYSMIVTPPAGNTGTISVDVAAGAATGTTSGLGNTDATAATQAFDTAPPASVTAIALNPASDSAPVGDDQTTDITPTLTLTLNALLGSDTMRVFLDGSSTPLAGTLSGSGTTVDFTPTAPIAAGSHSFSASAIDAAGNVSPLLPSPYTLLIL